MEQSIKTYSLDDLTSLMKEWEQPTFRAKQLYEWLHTHHVSSYDEMTNLPKALRQKLEESFPLTALSQADLQVSRDGTRKYVLEMADGVRVETVGIPTLTKEGETTRLTVCVSSQSGCPMGCIFCATGHEGFTRNLSSDEIVDQVHVVQNDFAQRVSNVVVMGQGEPFLNYDATLAAIRKLNEKQGLNIGARHITVSTCGIIDGINRFSNEPEQFTLAISLHSAIQSTRDILMPHVSRYPLTDLKKALQNYIEKTNRRVTLEHLLIQGVNDSNEDLEALKEFCHGLMCHINLLSMNSVEDSNLKGAALHRLKEWRNELAQSRIETTIRVSHGSDIAGACGQLKNKH